MNKIILINALIYALAVALSVEASGGIESLKAKLMHRFPSIGARNHGSGYVPASYNRVYGGYGDYGTGYGGSAGAASSAASTGGGSSAASSAAAATGNNYGPNRVRHYDPYTNIYEEPVIPRAPRHRFHHGGDALASAAATASAAHVQPAIPIKPAITVDTYRRPIVNSFRHHPRYVSSYHPHHGGASSAAASAAAGGYGSGAAASAAAATGGNVHGHSNTLAAATGTYAGNNNGVERSAYKRSTENLQNHENGHVDDNHYYNANSYGKTADEKLHEAYNNNNEDVEQTPFLYRSKKSGENYELDYNKAKSESGSGVLAKDRHSSAFNKNSNRLIENVDQSHLRQGDGIIEDTNLVSTHNLDDEDEEIFDSDGHNGGFAGNAAAAAAASAKGANHFGGSAAAAAAAAAEGRH